MATWLPHLRLTFGGTLGNPAVETWANSLRFKIGADDSPTVASTEMDAAGIDIALPLMEAPLKAWIASADSKICVYATMTWAKLAWIKSNGQQRDAATHQIDITAPRDGSQNTVPPFYQTFALTLRTAKPRGRAHSGRIYPPMVSQAIQANGYIDPTAAGTMASSGATLINALAAAIWITDLNSPAVYPVVASPVSVTGPDAGGAFLQRITGVVVDGVPDVQHSRTRQLARQEGPTSATPGSP